MFRMGKKVDAVGITKEMQNGKALLIDVRGDDEWKAGHAKDGMHLSVDRIMQGELPTKDTSTKLYLYCASGGRAGTAANKLNGKGFETKNIGGLSSWRIAGGEVE